MFLTVNGIIFLSVKAGRLSPLFTKWFWATYWSNSVRIFLDIKYGGNFPVPEKIPKTKPEQNKTDSNIPKKTIFL